MTGNFNLITYKVNKVMPSQSGKSDVCTRSLFAYAVTFHLWCTFIAVFWWCWSTEKEKQKGNVYLCSRLLVVTINCHWRSWREHLKYAAKHQLILTQIAVQKVMKDYWLVTIEQWWVMINCLQVQLLCDPCQRYSLCMGSGMEVDWFVGNTTCQTFRRLL